MYAGEIVERAPVDELFASPQHPYTVGLLGSIPRLDRRAAQLADHRGHRAEHDARRRPAAASPPRCPFVDDTASPRRRRWSTVGAGPLRRAARSAPLEQAGVMSAPLLEVEGLVKHFVAARSVFGRPTAIVKAVDGVSFSVEAGKTLALVGESGCGKSTVGRLVLRLIEPTPGTVRFEGRDLLRARRRRVARLPPRRADHLPGSLRLAQSAHDRRRDPRPSRWRCTTSCRPRAAASASSELLRLVGLEPRFARRYPHEFSGGQRQRIAIARALAVEPKLIVCDEPVSALDVSIRSQILNLLRDLQRPARPRLHLHLPRSRGGEAHRRPRRGDVSRRASSRPRIREELFATPRHPYTRALLSAIPVPEPRAKRSRICCRARCRARSIRPPAATFTPAAPMRSTRCRIELPRLLADAHGHATACHRTAELPPPDDHRPADGGFSPALERLMARFQRRHGSARPRRG